MYEHDKLACVRIYRGYLSLKILIFYCEEEDKDEEKEGEKFEVDERKK